MEKYILHSPFNFQAICGRNIGRVFGIIGGYLMEMLFRIMSILPEETQTTIQYLLTPGLWPRADSFYIESIKAKMFFICYYLCCFWFMPIFLACHMLILFYNKCKKNLKIETTFI
jgi:hypothetical protein